MENGFLSLHFMLKQYDIKEDSNMDEAMKADITSISSIHEAKIIEGKDNYKKLHTISKKEALKYFISRDFHNDPNPKYKGDLTYSFITNKVYEQAMHFYLHFTGTIEIFRHGRIERIHFMKYPYSENLTKETKNQFNKMADRSNTQTKVVDLIKSINDMIIFMKYDYRINSNIFSAILLQNFRIFLDFMILAVICVHFLIIIGYKTSKIDDQYERLHNVEIFGMTIEKSVDLIHYVGLVILG